MIGDVVHHDQPYDTYGSDKGNPSLVDIKYMLIIHKYFEIEAWGRVVIKALR